IEEFWAEHVSRVYPWYLSVRQKDDVVISASPQFLVAYACERIGVGTVIGSPVDCRTGKFSGPNCNRAEKVRRYREAFGDKPIDRFYSDSHSDDPLAALAKEAFLIKNGRVCPWE
ncbi:MAG: haloacid dehalogenase-like hydrolase, partial [Eubacteriales bacterium]|nr:haloacid dehalogenase-like hydrolase [Eubacteriales bacterium]